MIVDNHTVVRSGLSTFFAPFPDLVLVGEAENGKEAVALCGLLETDVILMDLIMPGTNVVEATRLPFRNNSINLST